MPKVRIDASIFTEAKAFGMVSGLIDVPVIPQIGDVIFFPPRGPPSAFAAVPSLLVTTRIMNANSDDPVSIMLDDITVAADDDARKVMSFFEECHGLFGDIWDDDAQP